MKEILYFPHALFHTGEVTFVTVKISLSPKADIASTGLLSPLNIET